jgi:hypothetical protein
MNGDLCLRTLSSLACCRLSPAVNGHHQKRQQSALPARLIYVALAPGDRLQRLSTHEAPRKEPKSERSNQSLSRKRPCSNTSSLTCNPPVFNLQSTSQRETISHSDNPQQRATDTLFEPQNYNHAHHLRCSRSLRSPAAAPPASHPCISRALHFPIPSDSVLKAFSLFSSQTKSHAISRTMLLLNTAGMNVEYVEEVKTKKKKTISIFIFASSIPYLAKSTSQILKFMNNIWAS